MHRSRLAGSVTDRQTGDLDAAAQFRREAWGHSARAEQDQGACREFDSDRGKLRIEVQAAKHERRGHLDAETDDPHMGVTRPGRLGARRTRFLMRWWAMEAPTVQRLCVVRPQHSRFEVLARERRT